MPAVPRLFFAYAFGLLLLVDSGCAPAYHEYSSCCINCRYCALPPLPYTHYKGCVCHSCAASKHLAIQPNGVDTVANDVESDASLD